MGQTVKTQETSEGSNAQKYVEEHKIFTIRQDHNRK